MSVHLQTEIEKLKKKVLSLSALVEDTVYRAVKSLRDRDTAMARSVIDDDTETDEREVDIEEECQKILALHQPVANDLRFIITVLKINAELERIGDAAANVGERVLLLVGEEEIDIPFDFPEMSRKVREMLRKSLDALINLDLELAYDVIAADDDVDAINRRMYTQVEEGIRKNPDRVGSLIHLLGISRLIERIGDHASNIAEDVVYLIEGRIIRHHTEKIKRPPHQT